MFPQEMSPKFGEINGASVPQGENSPLKSFPLLGCNVGPVDKNLQKPHSLIQRKLTTFPSEFQELFYTTMKRTFFRGKGMRAKMLFENF